MAPDVTDLSALTRALEAAFHDYGSNDDASHDIFHCRRVKAAALDIAARECAGDSRVLIAAAYLHDVVNLPKNAPERARASQLSAEIAAKVLPNLGFDGALTEATCHAIVAHSFSAGIPPETIEAAIFQDADRLEALGAIGIARTFFIAGRLGTALFEGGDPFASARALDDKRFALDHFAVKLLRLPETMRTEGGRALAVQRAQTMRAFLAALGQELGQPCPW